MSESSYTYSFPFFNLIVTGVRAEPRSGGHSSIEERITTIVVHPGWQARVDGFENVVMEMEARS